MRQTDDFEDKSGGMPIIYMALGVSFFVLLVMAIVIVSNGGKKNRNTAAVASVEEIKTTQQESEFVPGTDKRTAADLDFWDMYPETEEETKEEKKEEKTEESESTAENSLDDGKHIQIVYSDGSDEWVAINPYWEKNTYDFTNMVSNNGKLKYYSDGKKISYLGVDISRYQKDVDFSSLKEDGIEFVMIRLGARGYKTGALQLDEYFKQNIEGAINAGLDVGVYFYSQAVTQEEAIEEANIVIDNLKDYKIVYPVALDMEFVENDNARVETLSKDERTVISAAFLNRIQEAGYVPMLYGNTEWLLKRINLTKFDSSCIWLSEEADIPKYPYRYEMWQYTKQGTVSGIDGFVDLNISFVDYSAR
ncbi:MAG: glycoside hydrolase family 25 protein [Lachnospiraceae bacterium]